MFFLKFGLLLVLAVAVAAALGKAYLAFFAFTFGAPTREDEVLYAKTRDGWSLGLGRHRPVGKGRRPPVLFVHGIAMNRQAFDFAVDGYSMARYVANAGFDAFTLDLRGHGRSRRGPTRFWTLDDYLEEDLPAALDLVAERTGEPDVVLVGHSQGALLSLVAASIYPERVRAVVALAPPFRYDRRGRLKNLLSLRHYPMATHFRTFMQMLAPFVGGWKPKLALLSVNMENVDRPVMCRLMTNGLEDLQRGVVDQFAAFAEKDLLLSTDGKLDWRALLKKARQPALFVSAPRDGLAPPEAVEAGFDLWGGPKRYHSSRHVYGHVDLLIGRGAPSTIFPLVKEFLLDVTDLEAGAPVRAS